MMMLLLPPNNAPLCSQLLFSLLLMMWLGMVPEGIAGLECYSCQGQNCDSPFSSKVCTGKENACFRSGIQGSMKRGCYSKTDCHSDVIHSECYYPANHQYAHRWEQCKPKVLEEAIDILPEDSGPICVCDRDFCNDGPAKPSGIQCFRGDDVVTCDKGDYCFKEVAPSRTTKNCLKASLAQCFMWGSSGCEDSDPGTFSRLIRRSQKVCGFLMGMDLRGQFEGAERCLCDTALCNRAGNWRSSNRKLMAVAAGLMGMLN